MVHRKQHLAFIILEMFLKWNYLHCFLSILGIKSELPRNLRKLNMCCNIYAKNSSHSENVKIDIKITEYQ